jgi:hypothetical protein
MSANTVMITGGSGFIGVYPKKQYEPMDEVHPMFIKDIWPSGAPSTSPRPRRNWDTSPGIP